MNRILVKNGLQTTMRQLNNIQIKQKDTQNSNKSCNLKNSMSKSQITISKFNNKKQQNYKPVNEMEFNRSYTNSTIDIRSPKEFNQRQQKSKRIFSPLRKVDINQIQIDQTLNVQKQKFQPKQTFKIRQIINFLENKKNHKCLNPCHQYNQIRYFCMNKNCQQRFGCSYCFLNGHISHQKISISSYLKTFIELEFKVAANERLFVQKINLFYNSFMDKLQKQIQSIKIEFLTNLSFLKKKMISNIDNFFSNAFTKYIDDSSLNFTSNFIDQKNKVNNLKEQLTKLEEKNSKEDKLKFLIRNIDELNVPKVYSFLRQRLQILHIQTAQFKQFLGYFSNLNEQISCLFDTFKRNVPRANCQPLQVIKPNILSLKNQKIN